MARRMISIGEEFRVVPRQPETPVQEPTTKSRRQQRPRTDDEINARAAERVARLLRPALGRGIAPARSVPVVAYMQSRYADLLWLNINGESREIEDASRLDRVGVAGDRANYSVDQLESLLVFVRTVSNMLGPLPHSLDTGRISVAAVDDGWRARMQRWRSTPRVPTLRDALRLFDQAAWNRGEAGTVCFVCGLRAEYRYSPLWPAADVGVTPLCGGCNMQASQSVVSLSGRAAVDAYAAVEVFIKHTDERYANARGMVLNGAHLAGVYGEGIAGTITVWAVDGKAWLLTDDRAVRLGDIQTARERFPFLFQMRMSRLATVPMANRPAPRPAAGTSPMDLRPRNGFGGLLT